MTGWRVRSAGWCVCLLAVAGACGQDIQIGPGAGGHSGPNGGVFRPAETDPGVAVTGHVTCDDTQRPARFARVNLIPARRDDQPSNGPVRGRLGGSGLTDTDGNFRVVNVAPGDYYVQVNAPGYLSVRQMMQEEVEAGVAPADILARLPAVHVDTNGGTAAPLVLERGGAISGQVVWADGSPAAGLSVNARPMKQVPMPSELASLPLFGPFISNTMTDDRGRFRLTGVSPGEMVVLTSMQGAVTPPGSGNEVQGWVMVFAPGVFRDHDATPVTVHRGEERDDIRIVIDLARLHVVSGVVSAPGVSGRLFGNVQLTDATYPTVHFNGVLQADGRFALPFVPAGSYTMTVNGSVADGNGPGKLQGLQRYQGSVVVTESDLGGLSITLTPLPPQSASR